MDIVGKTVVHKVFGCGTVVSYSDNKISVQFPNKAALFVFPDAFSSFITTEDAELLNEIENAKKQREYERAKAEEKRQAEQREAAIAREQKATAARKPVYPRKDVSNRKNDTIALAVGETYDVVVDYMVTAHPAFAPYPSSDYYYFIPIKKGGSMEYVFSIQTFVECIPSELENHVGNLSPDQACRLMGYHKARLGSFGYNHHNTSNIPYRFYVCAKVADIRQPFSRKYIQISCGFQFGELPIVGSENKKARWATADGAWITPCNPEYYDAIGAFQDFDRISWKQSTNVKIGDIVYIYIGAPVQAVCFRCQAEKVDVPSDEIDDTKYVLDGSNYEHYGRYMEIVLLDKLSGDEWSFASLKEHGLTGTLQGPRKITGELAAYIDRISSNT